MIHIEAGAQQTSGPTVLTENILANGTLTPSSETAGSEGANAVEENTFDGWLPTAMPASLSVLLAGSDGADSLGIAAHNLGTVGATVFVEYLDGIWTEAASFSPADDSTLLLLFPEQTATEWRIRITGPQAPFVGLAMLGTRTLFQSGIVGDYTPTNWGARVEVFGGETISGQFLGQRVRRRGAETRVSIGRVSKAVFAAGAEAFVDHYNSGRPFFFAGWPDVLTNDIALCWRAENMREINPGIVQSDLVPLSFQVRCYVTT